MLVLSRSKDESIMIGDNVEIMVVEIQRNQIRLGIVAPKIVPVYRKEVYGRIRRKRNPASPKGFAVAGLSRNERLPLSSNAMAG